MMTEKECGFLATQYEKWGILGKDEVLNAYIDELEIDISIIGNYNEYLLENGEEPFFAMEEMDDVLSGLSPLEIVQKTYFGNFNYADDYLKFNGYENLDSFSEFQVLKEIKENREFLKVYLENLIDDEYINLSIKFGKQYLAAGF